VLAKGVVYNLHRSFFVVVDVWCVWWALRGVSAVGLGIIATEHEEFVSVPFFSRNGNIQVLLEAIHSEWTRVGYRIFQDIGMQYNVIVRCPLLDRRIVEWVAKAPPNIRLRGSTTKYVLRRAAQRLVPSSVLLRRDKANADHFIRDVVRLNLNKVRRRLLQGEVKEIIDASLFIEDIRNWLNSEGWFPIHIESALSILHWFANRQQRLEY
jgi:hypothetical protein